jgi:glycine hydroxymethyltransferase
MDLNVSNDITTRNYLLAEVNTMLNFEESDLKNFLNFTANENIMSRTARMPLLSDIAHRYHLGTAEVHNLSCLVEEDGFIFKGLPYIYRLEELAYNLFNEKIGATYSDFRPLSGVHANICSLAALTEVGEIILSIHPEDGGHFATAEMITRIGRQSQFVNFSRKTYSISLEDLEYKVKKYKPKALLLDHGATLFKFPISEIRQIIGHECLLIYDASHTLGLIYGGHFQDPLREGCDVLQGNTHKTFPGPQKAIISFLSNILGKNASQIISSGLVSSQHSHHSVALYITIMEMYIYGQQYAKQIVQNAKDFSKYLINDGFDVLTYNGKTTDSHLFFVRIPKNLTPFEACKILYDSKISINVKNVYGENLLRIGVQEITRMGLRKNEIKDIATIMRKVLLEKKSPTDAAKQIREIRNKRDIVYYSFDI